jgi:hypothetical protein
LQVPNCKYLRLWLQPFQKKVMQLFLVGRRWWCTIKTRTRQVNLQLTIDVLLRLKIVNEKKPSKASWMDDFVVN